jgi:hypothetical protein
MRLLAELLRRFLSRSCKTLPVKRGATNKKQKPASGYLRQDLTRLRELTILPEHDISALTHRWRRQER